MGVNIPSLVIAQGFSDSLRVAAAIDGHVMFITVLADILQKILQAGHFQHAVSTKAGWPVVRGLAFPNVSPDAAFQVVCRYAAEGDGPRAERAFNC